MRVQKNRIFAAMYRQFLILTTFLLLPVLTHAEGGQPIIEMKADRTMIYPQRMELTGEESLMDVLQMVPELLIAGYEDVISNYNLRIDNCAMNGDTRLILSQMKAKDISRIQICDNTGVAKGTIGMGRVLDINMKMPETLKGFVEGQGHLGKDMDGLGTANALYGSKHTDLYANTSYRHQHGDEAYLTLHMTNRFDDRNKLLSYFTQQYLDHPSGMSHKVMGRARYFHTFNTQGTELLIVGGYQYASDPASSSKLPLCNVELNTPLFTKRLSMMLGAEGDFLMTKQKDTGRSWDVFNNDIYWQFTYALPQWRFTVGNRVQIYNYKLKEAGTTQKYTDTRNNANACIIYVPDGRNQIQLGYYRKYYNPSHFSLFTNSNPLSDEEWAATKRQLVERTISQMKLAYAYSSPKLTVQTVASYYVVEDSENFTELGVSAYWKTGWLSMSGGSNLYIAKSGTFASVRFSPIVYLPDAWQMGMQMVLYTKQSPIRQATGQPVYGCLSVNKQFGQRWSLGVDWHDMFDAICHDVAVNRHAANIKLQYRF